MSLITTWILNIDKFEDLDESHLRAISVIVSLLFFVGLFILKDTLNNSTIIFSSILFMLSPYLNFYSRYYIHEPILASFSILLLISLFRYHKNGKLIWAFGAGLIAGIVFTTKETSLLIFGNIFIAFLVTRSKFKVNHKSISLFFLGAIIISVLLYSSFFTNTNGIVDSILTFKNYFAKSSNSYQHVHGGFYYLNLMAFNKFSGKYISEIFILIFMVIGIWRSLFFKSNGNSTSFMRLCSIFSIATFITLSLIPYKTPWNVYTAWLGLIIISGYGVSYIYEILSSKKYKALLILIFTLFGAHLFYQTYLTSYLFPSKEDNPYTYSQPEKNLFLLTNKVNEIISFNNNVKITTIIDKNEYWPLPWYFKKTNNSAWHNIPHDGVSNFDIIITEPKYLEEITELLFTEPEAGKIDLYVPLIHEEVQIRPGKKLATYIKNDLLNKYFNSQINLIDDTKE